MLHLNGEGVARDDAAAAKWLTRAANQEDAEAQFLLGLLYSIGRGVEGGQSVQKASALLPSRLALGSCLFVISSLMLSLLV